ncbi:MAG: 50S ribosomal protein L9 [Nitrospinales bacterium]
MKLLLKEDVENLGSCGDEVEVRDGYGRNYLIPKGKAVLATPNNAKSFNHQKSIVQARLRKLKNSAEEFAEKIGKVPCVFTKKVGGHGKLFGSVTSQEIAEFLREKGLEIDRRKIQMKEPIKTLGEFKVPLKLHAEVTAEINVAVLPEETPEAPAAEAQETEPTQPAPQENPETTGEENA